MDDESLDAAAELAFAELERVGGDPRHLDDPFRTVAVIWAAQGVIDNGGLRYFFGEDWPGRPPYELFSQAYRTIGATAEADAIRAGSSTFPFQEPERHKDQRRAFLESPHGEGIDRLEASLRSDVWALLADYVKAHGESFPRPSM